MALGDPICDPVSFRAEARYQRVCAVTGRPGAFMAHHVVREQDLRDKLGLRGKALFDTRNALRVSPVAHGRHHLAFRKIRTTELEDQNIEYAFEALGASAGDYLRRYYDDDTLRDPRIVRMEEAYDTTDV